MKKLYCNICNKFRKSKNSKISYIFKKSLRICFAYNIVVMNIKKSEEEQEESGRITKEKNHLKC